MQNQTLLQLIKQTVPEQTVIDSGISYENMMGSVLSTKLEFCPNLTAKQVFEQEKQYYIQHGMSAFDCGYCGKSKQMKKFIGCLVKEVYTGTHAICDEGMINSNEWLYLAYSQKDYESSQRLQSEVKKSESLFFLSKEDLIKVVCDLYNFSIETECPSHSWELAGRVSDYYSKKQS